MLLFFGGGYALIPPSQKSVPNNQEQPTKTENRNSPIGKPIVTVASKQDEEKRENKGDWKRKVFDHLAEHITDWLLALFTAVLSFFTARLFYATSALAKAERPHLIPEGIRIRGIRNTDANVDGVVVEFSIKNYGRSPAIVTKMFMAGRTVSLPDIPTFSTPPLDTYVIVPPDLRMTTADQNTRLQIPARARETVVAGEKTLFIYGRIEYEEISRKPHSQNFAYKLTLGEAEGADRLVPAGPRAHWAQI